MYSVKGIKKNGHVSGKEVQTTCVCGEGGGGGTLWPAAEARIVWEGGGWYVVSVHASIELA